MFTHRSFKDSCSPTLISQSIKNHLHDIVYNPLEQLKQQCWVRAWKQDFWRLFCPLYCVPHAVLEQFLQRDWAFLSGRAVALVCVSVFQQVIQTIITQHCLWYITTCHFLRVNKEDETTLRLICKLFIFLCLDLLPTLHRGDNKLFIC